MGFLAYAPSPHMGFVLDDHYVIAQNPVLKSPSRVLELLTSGFFDAAYYMPESGLNYYRPVVSLSFAVGYWIWGLNPFAERIVNIVIHGINTLLVLALFSMLFKPTVVVYDRQTNVLSHQWRVLYVMAAMLFCAFPVHEWVVRYITGRGDLLQSMFSLASLLGVVFYLKNNRKFYLWISLLLFVGALLSREAALIGVCYVFIVAYFTSQQLKRAVKLSVIFGMVAGAYYVLRLMSFPINAGAVVGLNDIPNGIMMAGEYLLRLLMPYTVMVSFAQGKIVAALLLLVCAVIVGFQLIKSRDDSKDASIVAFAIFWIAIGLLPFIVTQRIIPRLGPILSEHFLYFLSAGFALLLAFLINTLSDIFFNVASCIFKESNIKKLNRQSINRIPTILTGAVFVFCVLYFSEVVVENGKFWQSEEMLLRRVSQLEGQKPTVAFEQLAMRYDQDENKIMGIIYASTSNSVQSLWYKRLGNLYHQKGDYPAAIASLHRAIELDANNVQALNELAVCLWETARDQEGLEFIARSLEIDDNQADAQRLLGVYYYRKGSFDKAIVFLNKAASLDPDQKESVLHLMMAYYFLNDMESYLQTVNRAASSSRDDRVNLRFAAKEFFARGYYAEVIKVLTHNKDFFNNDQEMLSMLQQAQLRLKDLL